MKDPIYLIDGSGYIFRAYYAIRPLTTSTGLPTNAVFGFARMLLKLIREHKPKYLGIAFDPKENLRREMYDQYKSNREAPPEDLIPQFALIHELVEAMDIPVLLQPGYEADDVLATLTKKALEHDHHVVVVSGDKDLMQLVKPPEVDLYDPMKDKHFDREAVIERFGVPPENVVDVLALCGDASDNIPGVPKIGAKSAAKLVQEHGALEEIIAKLQTLQHTQKLKAYELSLLEHIEDARLSHKLSTLMVDVPLPFDLEKLFYTPPAPEKLAPFLQKIEAFALIKELQMQEAVLPLPIVQTSVEKKSLSKVDYQTLDSIKALQEFLSKVEKAKKLCLHIEASSENSLRAEIIGIALSIPYECAGYIPITHLYLGITPQISLTNVLALLRPFLLNPMIQKMGHNLKFVVNILHQHGINLDHPLDDAMLKAYVLDPGRLGFSLEILAREFLQQHITPYNDVVGTGKKQVSFSSIPIAQATLYAAEQADVAAKLCEHLQEQLQPSLTKLYQELEIPLLPVLAHMEQTGILVDIEYLKTLSMEFSQRLKTLEQQVQQQIDTPINLASPKQLAELFFTKLQYPVVKKTKTGYSTDQEVLEILAESYELPRLILEHRLLSKLKSTYIDALPRMLNPKTQRVHTSFNQTVAATGRLSSTDPNLQNIPIRGEDGKRLRQAFIAKENCVLIAADYSQIELRLVAHLSEDENFISAFLRGEDIHQRTAQEILTGGLPPDAEMRRRAKAINFGILYGLSEFGLAKQLDISRITARDYISRYFGRYPKIRGFLDNNIEEGRRLGYVTTMLGRRRYLPELNSKNGTVQRGAERIAMNSPIQGSAADIIKLAMLEVHKQLEHFKTRLLLQVHDELVFEAPREEIETVIPVIRQAMSDVVKLKVPLIVDIGQGKHWGEAH